MAILAGTDLRGWRAATKNKNKLQIIKEIVILCINSGLNWEYAGNEDLQQLTMETFSEYHISIYLFHHINDGPMILIVLYFSIYYKIFHFWVFWSKYSCCWLVSSLIGFLHGLLSQLDYSNYLDSVQSTIWLSEDLR